MSNTWIWRLVVPVLLLIWFGFLLPDVLRAFRRRRHLRTLGFTKDDLKSKQRTLEKWAEVMAAKLPDSLHFSQLDSYSWPARQKRDDAVSALQADDFRSLGLFRAAPFEWVADFYVNEELRMIGAILCTKLGKVHLEFMTAYEDGSTVAFENTVECGHHHPLEHQWIHCGPIPAKELCAAALRDRLTKPTKAVNRATAVPTYEQAMNASLAQRKREGFTAKDVQRLMDRQNKGRKEPSSK